MNNFLITSNLLDFLKSNNCVFLLEEISQAQKLASVKIEDFQVWKLKRKYKNKFLLEMQDGNYKKILQFFYTSDKIEINKLSVWFENETLYFPSER